MFFSKIRTAVRINNNRYVGDILTGNCFAEILDISCVWISCGSIVGFQNPINSFYWVLLPAFCWISLFVALETNQHSGFSEASVYRQKCICIRGGVFSEIFRFLLGYFCLNLCSFDHRATLNDYLIPERENYTQKFNTYGKPSIIYFDATHFCSQYLRGKFDTNRELSTGMMRLDMKLNKNCHFHSNILNIIQFYFCFIKNFTSNMKSFIEYFYVVNNQMLFKLVDVRYPFQMIVIIPFNNYCKFLSVEYTGHTIYELSTLNILQQYVILNGINENAYISSYFYMVRIKKVKNELNDQNYFWILSEDRYFKNMNNILGRKKHKKFKNFTLKNINILYQKVIK